MIDILYHTKTVFSILRKPVFFIMEGIWKILD
nr:MAG TPA: hypothetical protein [Caudoviricetes sp.]